MPLMPLTRDNVTRASRIMLPYYPVVFAWFGLPLLLQDPAQLSLTPSYAYAATWMPFRTWGILLLAVAILQVSALATHRRYWYITTLGIGAAVMLVWGAVFFWAAAHGQAPWSAPNWPCFVAVACLASMVSLESRER